MKINIKFIWYDSYEKSLSFFLKFISQRIEIVQRKSNISELIMFDLKHIIIAI